ncbi:MAG: pilus assembly PilX N-terminal domain-containing protein [Candidatus Eisenbacteria sp.]|nr:pilus assembly PilX N-terminal domain-containing protein [Candidatus Eisenbacteria bacterium]
MCNDFAHQRECRRLWKDEKGMALVIALSLLAAMSMLGALYVALSSTEGRIAVNENLAAKALMMAESSWNVAYREFSNVNFHYYTHNADGSFPPADALTYVATPHVVLDDLENNGLSDERNNGDFVWEWQPGNEHMSLSGGTLPESFRFRIYPRTDNAGEDELFLECTGRVGNATRTIRIGLFKESGFKYAVFSDGDLGEFTRGRDQTIAGPIHANGDICFRPEAGQTLSLDSESVTCTGEMIRSRDVWGRPAPSGSTVEIKDGDGVYQEMDNGDPGEAFDSENPDWLDCDETNGIEGALEKWDGIVRDGQLGGQYIKPPDFDAFKVGGYYECQSGLRIHAADFQTDGSGLDITGTIADAIYEVTFWNPNLDQFVMVQEIDLALLAAAGCYPANGLIFSDQPVRLVNAGELQAPLTVVADNSIYTKGSFNGVDKKPAALVSTGRVWHLSDNWRDDDEYTKGSLAGRQASDGTTIINAGIVDGAPTINEANWADLDDDGTPDGYSGDAWANSDWLLEVWGGGPQRVLVKRGAVIHLQKANMADDPESNVVDEPGEIAWQKHSAYMPPIRDYAYDPDIANPWFQPPFTLNVAKIFSWEEVIP